MERGRVDKRIGFRLYQSCGNSGSIGRVSMLRWCMWEVGREMDQGLEGWWYVCVSCESGFSVWMAGLYIVLGGYLRSIGAPSVQSCFTLSISAFYHVFVYGKYRLVCVWLTDLDLFRHHLLL